MKKTIQLILVMTIALNTSISEAQKKNNPLLQEWKTPYETPPFEQIRNEHFEPAIKYALKEAKKNIEKIAKSKTAPTFENTVVVLEKSSVLLNKVTTVFFNLNECNTNDEMQKMALKISPELTRFSNETYTDTLLFKRIDALFQQKESLNLSIEQKTLLEKTHQKFVRNGVMLSIEAKAKLNPMKEELSSLEMKFYQNAIADRNRFSMHITETGMLDGLSASLVESAAEAAKAKQLTGWLFTLDAPSYMPFMQNSAKRSLREKMWRAYNQIGNNGNEYDNNDIVKRITFLRLQVAQLLGYNTYADYILADRMAKDSKTVNNFLAQLLEYSKPYAQKELKELQDFAKTKGHKGAIERWDWSYFAEQQKEAKYSISQETLRLYFPVERVQAGIFGLLGELYGLTFTERKDIPVYHPDVKAYEVKDGEQFMGVLYLDLFPRESKSGGAWATSFRRQWKDEKGRDIRPQIQIVCNFSKPTEGKPALLTFSEFTTFLHEFGHAVHGMLSEVTYNSLSCTQVYRDFVELPSQLMENWATEKEFLSKFARHYQRETRLPTDLIDKIVATQQYHEGYATVRQLSFGMLDMAWHTIADSVTMSVADFEKQAIAQTELLPTVANTAMSTSFGHVFSGSYAAGYYGYKWAEVLDADVFSLFLQNGIFDKKTATSFRENILSKGGTEPAMVLYKRFRGSEPDMKALLKRAGFEDEKKE